MLRIVTVRLPVKRHIAFTGCSKRHINFARPADELMQLKGKRIFPRIRFKRLLSAELGQKILQRRFRRLFIHCSIVDNRLTTSRTERGIARVR